MRKDYNDTIINTILRSDLLPKKQYKYSDFTFIILKQYLEKKTGKSLDQLTYENFYQSLGMNNTLYNPLTKFDKNVIAPTEDDTYFRQTTVQGYVHDMEAAMEGGVAGHAGVFSNALDVAKMMQLFLQKGQYGGVSYFSPETFEVFNTCHFCAESNRRGLGFDNRNSAVPDQLAVVFPNQVSDIPDLPEPLLGLILKQKSFMYSCPTELTRIRICQTNFLRKTYAKTFRK